MLKQKQSQYFYKLFKIGRLAVFLILVISCQFNEEKKSESDSFEQVEKNNSTNLDGDSKNINFEKSLSTDISADTLSQDASSLNQQGILFRNNAKFREALNTHFEALKFSNITNDTINKIFALNNIGTDLRRTSSYLEASKYYYQALELANTNKKYQKNSAIAMNGLGNIFLYLDKLDDAQAYFEKCLQIEQQLESKLGQAINYANLGEVFKKKGDYEIAINYYDKSLQLNENIESNIGIAICKNAIGRIYLKQGRNEDALVLLKESVEIMEDSKDAFHQLEMQTSLCETLINSSEINEAQLLLNDIMLTAQNINSLEYLQIGYELQSKLSRSKKDYESALAAKELAVLYKDSTVAQNNEVRILELENTYKNKEARQQIKLLIAKNQLYEKNKSNQLIIFIPLSLFMLSIIGFTYYRYKNKRKIGKELQNVNDIKSRFFSNISHEFRTPLTLIKGPLEKVLNNELPINIKDDLAIMYRNTNRLLHLVNQILSLSKIDVGKFQISAQKADISEEIKGIAQSFEYLSINKNLNYKLNIQESGLVWFDSEIIEIILTNLLSNAFKFTPDNGNINISARKVNNNYHICISNTYEGLSKEDFKKMFSRYYSSASSNSTGTGIGLSLVKELCTLYRAKPAVVFKKNNEIEFTIIIPTNAEHFTKHELQLKKKYIYQSNIYNEINPLEDDPDIDNNKTKKPLILIVEDNEDMRNYVKGIFKNDYQILTAIDGKEGIDVAKTHIPDIIISDVMMPKIDGITLCNILKTDILTNHIPIILLTALSEEENVLSGLENKADDYMSKPFTIKILQSKVRNLIQIRKTLSEKYREEIIIKPANILLNTNNHGFDQILKEVLEKHITNPDFDVKNFCDIASMSRTQLHRKLAAITNMSSTEFIRTHRLKLAAKLLTEDDLNISDACYAAGFSNTSYFSKQFKILYKKSPKKYKDSFASSTK